MQAALAGGYSEPQSREYMSAPLEKALCAVALVPRCLTRRGCVHSQAWLPILKELFRLWPPLMSIKGRLPTGPGPEASCLQVFCLLLCPLKPFH